MKKTNPTKSNNFTKAQSLGKVFLLSLFFFAVIIGTKTYIIDHYTVLSPSMLPSLKVGDKIWIKKYNKTLKTNDIAAFYAPNGETTPYIKRCIGAASDTLIRLNDGSFSLKNNTTIADNSYFIIPKKNTEIQITVQNLSFYKPLIEQQEGGQIGIVANQLYINGEIRSTYTFRQNYYFMVGDNRENSQDSREWGLVGEQSVFGKW